MFLFILYFYLGAFEKVHLLLNLTALKTLCVNLLIVLYQYKCR